MTDRVGSRPVGTIADGAQQFVITLSSSTAPVALEPPVGPELEGLVVFRSRTVEDGRERFRVHLGYFASRAAAEQVLPIVRRSHPAALIAPTPRANMGSLDDTAIAKFRVLKPVEPPPVLAPPLGGGRSRLDSVRFSRSPPEYLEPPVLRPTDAVRLPPRELSPAAAVTQQYAIQLVWTHEPLDVANIPWLAIFTGYLLYGVETAQSGRRWYGIRLGFFADAAAARLVAHYVRSDFKAVAVVPVSDREVTRASGAAISLTAVRAARGALATRARWPDAAVPVDAATMGQAVTVATSQ